MVAQNHIDLGHVKVGTQIMQKIQIRNTGKSTITFASKRNRPVYQITRTAGDFKINLPREIQAGQTKYISVVYTAKKFGADTRSFKLANNSINLPNLTITASAVSVTSDNHALATSSKKPRSCQKIYSITNKSKPKSSFWL